MPTSALALQCQGDDDGPSSTLSPRIGGEVQEIYALMEADQYQQALVQFDQLLAQRGSSMSQYEIATVRELRANVMINLDRLSDAKRDLQTALNTGALPASRNNQIRYFIAQLEFQDDNFQAAISGLNSWIQNAQRCNEPVDYNAWYLLAAAYYQTDNYQAALSPAQNALQASKRPDPTTGQVPEPKKSAYDLLNIIYSELGRNDDRAALLEEIIGFWPGDKPYWTQLSGLYQTTGKDREAFSVLEVAYRAGLLDKESELLNVVRYLSFLDNPYRAAVMLDREMNAGNIERTQDNLVLLSQLWSQSREHKRAIPILREAAGRASDGTLFYRLGQVLLADEQYAAAETALRQAVNKGGMDRGDTGDAWALLGTAQFNQAGPEDTAIWRRSRASFVNAQRYESSRRQAAQWIGYIDAVIRTYENGVALERAQTLERCQEDQRRFEQQEQIRSIQGRDPTAEERAAQAEFEQRCNGPLNLDGSADQPAEDEDGEAADEPADETTETEGEGE
ncbi:MAG: hypothetical protein AAGD92_09210 [Pseudomonadota bacterium]